VSDGKLGIELPDGARQYEFEDGHICAWSFSSARANPLRFETPQAARLSWALTKKSAPAFAQALRESLQLTKDVVASTVLSRYLR
jgi:hypothetical protein